MVSVSNCREYLTKCADEMYDCNISQAAAWKTVYDFMMQRGLMGEPEQCNYTGIEKVIYNIEKLIANQVETPDESLTPNQSK
jgi:hypothetical protein